MQTIAGHACEALARFHASAIPRATPFTCQRCPGQCAHMLTHSVDAPGSRRRGTESLPSTVTGVKPERRAVSCH
eukprot:490127-Rhodomonas_salina.2